MPPVINSLVSVVQLYEVTKKTWDMEPEPSRPRIEQPRDSHPIEFAELDALMDLVCAKIDAIHAKSYLDYPEWHQSTQQEKDARAHSRRAFLNCVLPDLVDDALERYKP